MRRLTPPLGQVGGTCISSGYIPAQSRYFRRIANVTFWVIAVALAANLARMSRQTVRAAPVQPAPYTTTLREDAKNQNGIVTLATYYTFAQRSDGSSLFKVDRSAVPGPTDSSGSRSIRILEFAALTHVEIRDLWELKSTRAASHPPLRRDLIPGCRLPQETALGEETMAGYRAIKVSQGPRTSWYAPDHGCALVREVVKFNTGEVSEKTLVALIDGEPDPLLFSVPSAYQEVPPSKIAFGMLGVASSSNAHFVELDKYYHAHRLAVGSSTAAPSTPPTP